ncbi:RCC1 domain-containing protein 1 isoform X6 [Carettochelys insculpta]|uniref:RCC1 domain-containing protein 1 isoform X6 n=1 Tax=Carettochelys insculpta TaxID=44489 RepID=UPI003EBD48FB
MAQTGPLRGWFEFGFRGFAEPPCGGARRVEPEPGGIRVVRPAWSYTGLVTGRGCLVLRGATGAALPGRCRDLLPSESHVLLLRGAALEAWARGAGLVWRRRLRPGEAAGPPALPRAPGGYVVLRPPFLRPLPPGLRARKLVLGHEHAALLGPAGAVYTWGSGRHGQLGHGALEAASEPRLVEALHGVPMRDVAAGGWHSISVSEAGDLYVWGWNESGQLALPSLALAEKRLPATAAGAQLEGGAGEEQRQIAGTGVLYTWGWGKYGQLGHGNTASSDQPRPVGYFSANGLMVEDVVCGPWNTYVCAAAAGEQFKGPAACAETQACCGRK